MPTTLRIPPLRIANPNTKRFSSHSTTCLLILGAESAVRGWTKFTPQGSFETIAKDRDGIEGITYFCLLARSLDSYACVFCKTDS